MSSGGGFNLFNDKLYCYFGFQGEVYFLAQLRMGFPGLYQQTGAAVLAYADGGSQAVGTVVFLQEGSFFGADLRSPYLGFGMPAHYYAVGSLREHAGGELQGIADLYACCAVQAAIGGGFFYSVSFQV